MYMHVLEIPLVSGGLVGCVGYILYSTVVVYMFNFMTYPKCSTYAVHPCASLLFFILSRIAFFWFSLLKTDGLTEQGKATCRLLWKTRDLLFKVVIDGRND